MTGNKLRIILVGLVVPIVIIAAGVVLMLSWIPTLPAVVAIHWSGVQADGFAPVWVPIVLPVVITGVFVAFAVSSALAGVGNGSFGRNQKFLLAVGVWLSVVMATVFAGTLAIQRTVALGDAVVSPDGGAIALILASGVGAGIVLAALAWIALPKADDTAHRSEPIGPMPVSVSERLTWTRTARFSTGILVVMGVIVVAAVVIVAVSAARSGTIGLLFAWVILVLSALLVSVTARWRVTADSRGLIVRSWVGWPRVRVPAADIASVRVVNVSAGGEFGGYGIRWGIGGGMGVILRSGQALEVTRNSGRTVLVTVDDAETAAGVLATYQGQRTRPAA